MTKTTYGAIAVTILTGAAIWLSVPTGHGLSMRTDPLPPVPPGHKAFVAWFQPPVNMDPNEDYVVYLLVRPAIYSWNVVANAFEAKEVELSFPGTMDPVKKAIEVKFEVPEEWLCAELTILAKHVVATNRITSEPIPESEALHAGVHESKSNTMLFGDCPDPMPYRYPLANDPEAVPEPSIDLAVVVGFGLLLCLTAATAQQRRGLRAQGQKTLKVGVTSADDEDTHGKG